MIILKDPCMESILFILLALVGLCLGWRLVEWHPFLRWGFLGLVVLSLTAAWQWRHIWVKDELSQRAFHQTLPKEGDQAAYVSSATCQSCHPSQHHSWHASHHRTMTQFVSQDAVLARFEKVSLNYLGRPIELSWEGDSLWATMDEPEWLFNTPEAELAGSQKPPLTQRYQLGLMTGAHHMQVFWIPSGQGNAQRIFPFCFLTEDQRWVPFKDTFLRDPSMSHYDQSWNANCINCHVTQGRPMPTSPTATQTAVAELGIACEACHGPAAQHVSSNHSPMRRYEQHGMEKPDPTIVNPAHLDHERSSMVCGQCHGIHWISDTRDYYFNGFRYRPGGRLDRNKKPIRATRLKELPEVLQALKQQPRFLADRFWPDGMVRVSGREFTGMVESPCYEKGSLSCLSCHQMHHSQPGTEAMEAWRDDQLKPEMEGSASCLQCHESIAADIPAHTHHSLESSGSDCYNCHMPHTTYGLMKAIRSHQIDVPSTEQSLKTGRPNACNLCHLDQTLSWTASHLEDWYGQAKPDLPHDDDPVAASLHWLLKGDAGIRALTAWHYGWEPAKQASGRGWQVPLLAGLLEDPYSAVRYITQRSLKSYEGLQDLAFDFTGDTESFSEAAQWVRQEWEQTMTAMPGPSDPQKVLFRTSTEWDTEKVKEWQSLRSNRSMDLQE